MSHFVSARVSLVVELPITEDWNENSTIEQVHRQAKEAAIKRIEELCRRYVTIVGTPRVVAVMSTKEDRNVT